MTAARTKHPPAIPIAGLVDGITPAPGLSAGKAADTSASKDAPFGAALSEMLEVRYALKVRHSRLLSSPDWISLFANLG